MANMNNNNNNTNTNNSYNDHAPNRNPYVLRYDARYHGTWFDNERRGACGALVDDIVASASIDNDNDNDNDNSNNNENNANADANDQTTGAFPRHRPRHQITMTTVIDDDDEIKPTPMAVHSCAGVTLWLIPTRAAADRDHDHDGNDNDNNGNDNNGNDTEGSSPRTRIINIDLLEPSVLAFLRNAADEVGVGWLSMTPFGPGGCCRMVFLKDG